MKVRVIGIPQLKGKLKGIKLHFASITGREVVQTAAKHLKRTYARKVDTGRLKRSIFYEWDESTFMGSVNIGGSVTTRPASRGSGAIDYAEVIEYGFKEHAFPMSTVHRDSKVYSSDSPYGSVKAYGGLHGLPKSVEKTQKELPSITKKTFKLSIGR